MTPILIQPADPASPAAIACLSAYFQLLGDKIPGITPAHMPLPDPKAHTYRPPHGQFLIAWHGDQANGCVSLRTLDPGIGEVKRLWVAPHARGHGLARRLMAAIETQARSLGLHSLKLDTNAALTEAIALYQTTGWHPTGPYSGFPSTHWFAKDI